MLVSEQDQMFETCDHLMTIPGRITGADRAFLVTVNRVPPQGQAHLPYVDGDELYAVWGRATDDGQNET